MKQPLSIAFNLIAATQPHRLISSIRKHAKIATPFMKLKQITEGSTVTGLTASNAVTIVAVTPVGEDAVSVVYTDD